MKLPSACLADLSPELYLNIIGRLDRAALRHLSSTCSSYRTLLAPTVFESFSLRDTTRSALSANALANGRLGIHVKEFKYIPSALYDQYFYDAVVRSVRESLSTMNRFSNLHTFSFQCPYNSNDRGLEEKLLQRSYNNKDYDLEGEGENDPLFGFRLSKTTEGLCVLMNVSYLALSSNERPCFTMLGICELLFNEVDVFHRENPASRFGTLERLDLLIRGENNADRTFDFRGCYTYLLAELTHRRLKGFLKVNHLTIQGGKCGALGQIGVRCVRFAVSCLNWLQTSCLKSLKLKNISISKALFMQLSKHQDTLETIHLNHCSRRVGSSAEEPRWKWMFDCLRESKPRALRHFDISPFHLPISQGESPTDEDKDHRRTRILLEQDKSKRLFPYASDVDGDGAGYDWKKVVEYFLDGEDLEAYDRLVQFIRENNAAFISRLMAG